MTRLFAPNFPSRMVHLDFHTGPNVSGIGEKFDASEFASIIAAAHIDSVTVFAKCHHGHLYYDTDRPERHPYLPRSLNLLDEQVEALHRRNIKAPIYLSVEVDEYAANTHPEWVAQDDSGTPVKRRARGPFEPGWQILDMSSPYQDYLAEQLDEVLNHFSTVDGIFLDMCWDQPSTTKWAIDAMRANNLDPARPEHRRQHARVAAHKYMRRYRDMVRPHLSSSTAMSVWFNSRPKTSLADEAEFVSHVEIESLPTGGWGYSYFPYIARFVSPLGLPTLSHTGRFFKSWGDSGGLKSAAALNYECQSMLARGVTAGIGDLMHPSGALDPAVYDLIGSTYEYLASCSSTLEGGQLQSDVAVLMPPELGDDPGYVGLGVVRGLQQLRQQFDVVPPHSSLTGYKLVIIPECTTVDVHLAERLKKYVGEGNSLLVSSSAAVNAHGAPILDELGIAAVDGLSNFSHTFLSATEHCGADLTNAEKFPHVMYERIMRFTAQNEASVPWRVTVPYFERRWDQFSGHDYTPSATLTSDAAVIVQGNVATFAAPIFTAIGKHGADAFLSMLRRVLLEIHPEPLLKVTGPRHLETSVIDTNEARIVQLVSYLGSRQGTGQPSGHDGEIPDIDLIHDPFPVLGAKVSVRSKMRPEAVTLEPGGVSLSYTHADGYTHVELDILNGHCMLVLHSV